MRLRGQVDAIDRATGEVRTTYSTAREPDETLLKCCSNRREAVCASCAATYSGDAFQIVAAGLRGGKGVPEAVAQHPIIFLRLTAPQLRARAYTATDRHQRGEALPGRRHGAVCPWRAPFLLRDPRRR